MPTPTLSYCGEQAKHYDKDRFLCALFSPPEAREALFTLLAFNHEIARIPEMVSEPLPGMIRLQWWRDAIEGIYQDDPRQHDIVKALHGLVKERQLTQSLFDDLLNAREHDLEENPPENMQELIDYVEQSSGNLSILMAEAVGIREAALLEAAKHTGAAWALTGIMRAMKFPGTKRLMLPGDRLEVSREDILAGKHLEATKPAARLMVDTAWQYIEKARQCRKHVPKTARGIFLPATIAKIYLKRIRNADYDLFTTDLETHPSVIHLKLLQAVIMRRY